MTFKTEPSTADRRLRLALWTVAIVLALIGGGVAIVTSSWAPLVIVFGLALPMIPFRSPMTTRQRTR